MPTTLPKNAFAGTDCFNRAQSHEVNEGRRHRTLRMPVVAEKLLRVLIVDDERDTTDVMAMLAWRWGYEAQGTYDGATALRAAARQTPDVVLLDIAMPHMDGIQVAQRLRGDARLRDCFLIAMTGCAESANLLRCREVGVDLVLIKPVDPAVLESVLNLECTRLGRSRRDRGEADVTPRILAARQLAEVPWEVVPDCDLSTTSV